MDENLKGLAGIGLQVIPSLGTLLGGPVAGAVLTGLAQAVGPILGVDGDDTAAISKAVTERPDEVRAAVQQVGNDPAALASLAQIAHEETVRLQEINQTARVELASEDRFVRWARPSCIWAVSATTVTTGLVLVIGTAAALYQRDAAMLGAISNLTSAAVFLIGPASAVAGVAAYGRTKEKLAGGGDGLPGPVGAVVGAVASVVKGAKK